MTAENLARAAMAAPRPLALLVVFAWLAMNSPDVLGQLSPGPGTPRGFRGFTPPSPPTPPNDNGNIIGLGGIAGQFGQLGGATRFNCKIAPNTPLKDLLPPPPLPVKPPPPWLVKELAKVPEVFFQRPLEAVKEPMTKAETEALVKLIAERDQKSRERIAFTLAKINYLNQKGNDQFLRALVESRPDLAGLPFIMGEACRMSQGVSHQFMQEVPKLRPPFNQFGQIGMIGFNGAGTTGFPISGEQARKAPLISDEAAQAKVAAWMQILAPEPAVKRRELVKKLADIKQPEATHALAKLAVFSLEKDVREDALKVLKSRPRYDYTAVLLDGLRYPWPEFAKYAGEAMVRLSRNDLVDNLVDFLDELDPRAPVVQDFRGRSVSVVRELVRLNHHHNCITCHAPATSDPDFDAKGFTKDFLTGQVTIPRQNSLSSPSPFGYGGSFSFPDLMLRIDVTYLRQDFSLMQKVDKGLSGAPEERFDFLVRTREATAKEVEAYKFWTSKHRPIYLSPNHQVALTALRQLTGLKAGVTAAAWRAALEEE